MGFKRKKDTMVKNNVKIRKKATTERKANEEYEFKGASDDKNESDVEMDDLAYSKDMNGNSMDVNRNDSNGSEDDDVKNNKSITINKISSSRKKSKFANSTKEGILKSKVKETRKCAGLEEQNVCSLFVKGFPRGTSKRDLLSLSSDIKNVTLPNSRARKLALFCFLEFDDEHKAIENHRLLQGKKINGAEIFVDFAGSKSAHKPVTNPKNVMKDRLICKGIPQDTLITEIADLFPEAFSLRLNVGDRPRVAHVTFCNEDDAAKAFESAENIKIRGESFVVFFPKVMPWFK